MGQRVVHADHPAPLRRLPWYQPPHPLRPVILLAQYQPDALLLELRRLAHGGGLRGGAPSGHSPRRGDDRRIGGRNDGPRVHVRAEHLVGTRGIAQCAARVRDLGGELGGELLGGTGVDGVGEDVEVHDDAGRTLESDELHAALVGAEGSRNVRLELHIKRLEALRVGDELVVVLLESQAHAYRIRQQHLGVGRRGRCTLLE
mmetsp:Transcript_15552/g.37016  ORF Transcript_15552/g.37016 Transcript_15552/m.37016 type:complete len:202 (-) Transcript_15552:593-1198(-)